MAARLSQLVEHLSETHNPNDPGLKDGSKGFYTVREEPLGAPKNVRIITIGAGASGINMIRTLRKHVTNFEHIVYEKNAKIGGTWFENRYPGCKCDIPSHNYQFSWRHNTEWSNFHSPAAEIEEYLDKVVEEERLGDAIKTSHQVTLAEWNEESGLWKIRVRNLETNQEFNDYGHFLLNASGFLNHWKWPDIPGLQSFNGELVHSAYWPEHFEYTGKRVAVIGNGSSGIQIVPALQPYVKRLVHFVRSPTWIVPARAPGTATGKSASILNEIEVDEKGNFSAKQIQKFKDDPQGYLKFVKAVEEEVNGNFPVTLKETPAAKLAFEKVTEYMKFALGGDERLCNALIPEFPVACRRLTPGTGYLESLCSNNVNVVTKEIVRIVPGGIQLASGEAIELDAIVCATGFDVSCCPRFPIIGRIGNLQETWKERPKAYMSCAVPNFPNYFVFLGPNGPIGHGSVFTITEYVAKYITRIILKCQKEGIKAIVPSQAVVEDFYKHIDKFMPRTAWTGNCRSWFKDGKVDGPVTALHPGSRIHFFHMLEQFRGEDWEYVYEKTNRFWYLGNGFSTKELDGGDKTWYLNDPDAF